MNPVQAIMQPNVIRALGLVGSVTSIIIGGKNLGQMKDVDKKWWYAGMAAVTIAGIVIFMGMKPKEIEKGK